MKNYIIGAKLIKEDLTKELVDWLNETQHYLKDINEGNFVYQIAKAPELPQNIRLENLREQRKVICFSVINRGKLWYDTLTESQKLELKTWYRAWLDVTETMVEPTAPAWLK